MLKFTIAIVAVFCISDHTISAQYDPIKYADFLFDKFPEGFKWGMATGAHNHEGGWNEDGKGESIWDEYSHRDPSPIADGSTGEISCDAYHKYKEDVQLLKEMGADVYRFSISWARVLPNGTLETVNELGINYYNKVIDELLANGIMPAITLYHWDLPQQLQAHGGWLNDTIIQDFSNYARLAFDRFGDRVKLWFTLNEALTYCTEGYGYGHHAPGVSEPEEGSYICAHNSLRAHAAAYRIYEQEFQPRQGGRCGIVLDTAWNGPLDPSNQTDVEAAERAMQFSFGWFATPVFHGKYPDVMRDIIDRKSEHAGRNASRLPRFTIEEANQLQGSFDFIGLNHYTTLLITAQNLTEEGWYTDQDVLDMADPNAVPAASSWLNMNPYGFRKLLNWIKNTFDNPEIMVTENGWSDDDHVGVDDYRRVSYFKNYINQVLKAVKLDGCNVTAYIGWTLMDSFTMSSGYTVRFGVHWVNFTDPNRPRTPKASALYLKEIFTNNGFVEPVDDSIDGVFDEDFQWGLATSSYQVEGGWDADGKGENIWDNFCHKDPSPIYDGSSGDVACDSYNKYKEDVQLLKSLGADYYRFSLSWSRILPNGTLAGGINQAGIDYYNNLIDELIANGIDIMITLYHWDLPQALQEIGGFLEESGVVPHFTDFARVAFDSFGDRVKKFITFNEPWAICVMGYETGDNAPGLKLPETGVYECAHNLLKSHASAYRLYELEFKETQKGQVGITLDSQWYEPEIPTHPDYIEAAERARQFKHGWFARPIFFGAYPQQMIDNVGSRLPTFNSTWVIMMNGSWDFLGLNTYTAQIVYPIQTNNTGWYGDWQVKTYQDASWPQAASSWLKTVPWGFRKLLNWIKETYDNPLLYVTENGFSDWEHVGLNDTGRSEYYRSYINEMLKAVQIDGCNIKSYTAWSLLDNFEWARGTSERFGVHWVNFTDPTRSRIPKASVELLKTIFANNGFPDSKPSHGSIHRFDLHIVIVFFCVTLMSYVGW